MSDDLQSISDFTLKLALEASRLIKKEQEAATAICKALRRACR